MNSRSLILLAIALVAGIAIGLIASEPLRDATTTSPQGVADPSSNQPERVGATPSRSPAPVGIHVAPTIAQAETLEMSAGANTPNPQRGDWDDRDGSAEPDELALPDAALSLYEEGAAEDFERFGDGPASTYSSESIDRETTEHGPSTDLEGNRDAESCLAPSSRCRRDADCCGASICRSRPGTISGHFICIAG